MERLIMDTLLQWKKQEKKKPLLLEGMRQVGKTWLLQAFGKEQFARTVYFDLEEEPFYQKAFSGKADAAAALKKLAALSGQPVDTADTLVILDDIDACPDALRALCSFDPKKHLCTLACAGRRLGDARAEKLFSEQDVFLVKLEPMDFTEFLLAGGDRVLAEYLQGISVKASVLHVFWQPLMEKFSQYLLTGGMPGAVQCWIQEKDRQKVQHRLYRILQMTEGDFSRQKSLREFPKILAVWQSLPVQLTGKNQKFLYSAVQEGARAREYEAGVRWLVNNDYARLLPCLADPQNLQKQETQAFRIYPEDTGLLQRMLAAKGKLPETGSPSFFEENRALVKNFTVQALQLRFCNRLFCWTQLNPAYEVDFLAWKSNRLIPMELELCEKPVCRNLKKYREKFGQPDDLQVCFSLANLGLEDHILYVPVFLAGETNRLIDEIWKNS